MISLGTDIVSTLRIKNMINKNGEVFLNRIFSEREQEYCNCKHSPWIHFSGKFAAKEAVKKALLSSNLINKITLSSNEILNSSNGVPDVNFIEDVLNISNIKLSISHCDDYAIAMAIVQQS